MTLPVLNDEQKARLGKALEYIAEQQRLILSRSEDDIDLSAAGSNTLMISHHLSLLSRIYLGNVYFELTEKDVCTAFEVFGFIKSVSMGIDPHTHKHKGYCFLEYDVPEAAYLAIDSMTGKEMGNRLIKVCI